MEILYPIIFILALAGFLVYASKSGKRMIEIQNKKIKAATTGKARVISQTPIGKRGTNDFGQYQCVKLKLEVWSNKTEPYQVFTYWNAGTLAGPYIEVGKEINIKIDAGDREIIYPLNIPSVEYSFPSKGTKKINND